MPTPGLLNNFGIVTHRFAPGGGGAAQVITHGYSCSSGQTANDDAAEIAAHWIARFGAGFMNDQFAYIGATTLRKIAGMEEAGIHAQFTAGSVANGCVTPAVAIRCTKTTRFAGRKYRGRMYLPQMFLREDKVNDAGDIDSTTLTGLQTAMDNYHADLDGTGTEPGMFLLHHDGTAPTNVIRVTIRTSVGTQRRRQALL